MNVAIFLDEVNEFNGPLMFIPGSHKLGVLEAEHDVREHHELPAVGHQSRHHHSAGGAGRHCRAQRPAGIHDPVPRLPGTCLDLQPLAMEPRQRALAVRVSNHIRRFKRPGYIAHRDFRPIQCLPDDCLVKHYDVPLPWKNGTPNDELKAA